VTLPKHHNTPMYRGCGDKRSVHFRPPTYREVRAHLQLPTALPGNQNYAECHGKNNNPCQLSKGDHPAPILPLQ